MVQPVIPFPSWGQSDVCDSQPEIVVVIENGVLDLTGNMVAV